MKNSRCLLIVSSFLFVIFMPYISFPQNSYSIDEALKVIGLIEKVDSEKEKPYSGPLREVKVTESELNSYLAFRVEHEEDVMKGLSLKLFDENRIEGKVLLNFEGKNLPSLLKPKMVFYFDGTIKVRERAVRLVIHDLFLDKEPVDPLILDTVIYLSSQFLGTESMSFSDWYELPYGLKDVKIKKGEALFYY